MLQFWTNFSQPMIKLQDCALDPRLVDQGIYQVGNKYYNNKINAVIEASATKKPVQWDFHSQLYQSHAFRPRLDIPVTELYRLRAQQIRDQYDYIILGYSGGADSDQMLQSFVTNHIHVDEVWCDWPHLLVDKAGWRWDGTNAAHNIHMEYLTCVKPTLKWLTDHHPEIHIHCSDSFAELSLIESDSDITTLIGPAPYTGIQRYKYINRYASTLQSQGKKVAIVIGIDKCFPAKRGHDIGFEFRDVATFVKSQTTDIDTVIYEYFFWTPRMPEIVITQAHQIWDILKINPEQTQRWLNKTAVQAAQRGSVWFDDVIKFTCYPNWDRTRFQVPKSPLINNTHYAPMLWKFRNQRFYQSWASAVVNSVYRRVDPKLAWADGQSPKSELSMLTTFIKIGSVDW